MNKNATMIIHAPGFGHCILLVALLFIVGGIFLVTSKYTKKESITGHLLPRHGLIQIFPDRAGVVLEVYIKFGQRVEKGQPLLMLSGDMWNTTDPVELNKLHGQLENLSNRNRQNLLQLESRTAHRRNEIEEQIRIAESELEQGKKVMHLLTQQYQLRNHQTKALGELYRQGFLPELQWLEHRQTQLGHLQQLEISRQNQNNLNAKLARSRMNLTDLADNQRFQRDELLMTQSSLQHQQLQLKQRSSYKILAPVGGAITALESYPGQKVHPQLPQLAIVPEEELVARLRIPGRAAAYAKPGQYISIRYDAFPYQHFGVTQAILTEIATASLDSGKDARSDIYSGSSYLATAQLENQFVSNGIDNLALQSGMTFRADLPLESRSLAAWVMEPVLRTTGQLW
jgi:membrane fusion protein